MLTVISPAKTLDFESPPITRTATDPAFLSRSSQLIEIMREHSAKDLSKLMRISPKLGELNQKRFKEWQTPFTEDNAKQALLAFKGDVYIGLAAETYTQRDFTFAQKNLRILSGLYGLLRPLDFIQPYRLEMGTKVKNAKGKNLYDYWGSCIAESLDQELAGHRSKTLINLASNEYFKSVQRNSFNSPVITPVFKDYSGGTYKVLSFYAKKARGSMTTYIVKNRINKPTDIKSFDVDGYVFNPAFSSDDQWVFTRKS
jgi:cytoplasmic iron level regulating protein YaaA (DUF328/UPF0246 family)